MKNKYTKLKTQSIDEDINNIWNTIKLSSFENPNRIVIGGC